MTDANDNTFTDALTGRRAPHDLDTRRAARLARYFDEHPRADRAVHSDPQGEAQLLAYLRAQPPDAVAPARPAEPARNPLQRLLAWLLPPGKGLGLRHAAGAAIVFGLAVGVFSLMPHGSDDDATSMKSLPRPSPGSQTPPVEALGAKSFGAPQVVTAADPQAAATGLHAALAAQGIASELRAQGDGWLVTANVPEDRRAATASQLEARGLTLERGGKLTVLFARPRP